jgi:hypothetical protein
MEVDQEKVRLEAEAEELAEAEMTPEVEARLVRDACLLWVMMTCQLMLHCAMAGVGAFVGRAPDVVQMW